MSTITVRKGKSGTTIHMKAGKGEDLRGVIESMFGISLGVDTSATNSDTNPSDEAGQVEPS